MELSRILITEFGDQQVIFLREKNGPRSFPILIGTQEALAIDRRLKGIAAPRPMTHDLLAGVIEVLDAKLDRITIDDLKEHTFIATLHLSQHGKTISLDARPSDAIALGAAINTPIYVSENVLEKVFQDTSSTEDRLEILRQRMEILRENIEKISARLNDPKFLAVAEKKMIAEHQRQLKEMQEEHAAIASLLEKFS